MRTYPISRIVLRLVQAAGWAGAVVLIFVVMVSLMGDVTRRPSVGPPPTLQMVLTSIALIFSACLNHAIMAIGLAIFDLAEDQYEERETNEKILHTLKQIQTNTASKETL